MRLAALMLVGCAVPSTSAVEQSLAPEVKRERAGLVRDSAAEMGVYNAALLGGIATSETNFAHCWEEAQYACKGPASSSCGGGPVIAGSADGPCSDQQGGLGMFQFDSGTYSQTIATYGESILTVEGNTAQAVAFVVDKVILDIPEATDWQSAVDWLNSIPYTVGDPLTERWAQLMACRYNGCCSGSATCVSRRNGYRDNAIDIFNEYGADFWRTADRCTSIPADGVIDQRTACYVAGGEPRYWKRLATGYGDNSESTGTTASNAPSNFAQWLLRPTTPGTYHLEMFVQGGTATAAKYQVSHGGETTEVVVDQTTADGFVVLGDFDLTGDGTESVLVGDNTGTADQRLVVDALRVTLPGDPGNGSGSGSGSGSDGDDLGGGGGCSTSGGGASLGGVLLALIAIVRRRSAVSS